MFYFIFLVFIYLIYIYIKFVEKEIEKQACDIENTYDFKELGNLCSNMYTFYNLNQLEINYKRYYSYNTIQKKVFLKKMNNYSYLDLFKCFHEIGHYAWEESSKRRNIISRILIIGLIIYRLILVPVFTSYSILLLIFFKNIINTKLYISAFLLYCIVAIIKMFSTVIIERDANEFAMKFIVHENILNGDKYKVKLIKKSCLYAIMDQNIISIIYLYINLSLFYYIFFI